MATLVTDTGESYEFDLICTAESGLYLCYAEAETDDPAHSPSRIFPEQSVAEIIPEIGIDRTTRLLHAEGNHEKTEPVDPRGPPHASRVVVDVLIR